MEKAFKEPTKHITQQWVKLEHYEAFVKCSKFRADFSVNIFEIERDDNCLMVHCRMTFMNIGRNLYMQRVILFICTALSEYQTLKRN